MCQTYSSWSSLHIKPAILPTFHRRFAVLNSLLKLTVTGTADYLHSYFVHAPRLSFSVIVGFGSWIFNAVVTLSDHNWIFVSSFLL